MEIQRLPCPPQFKHTCIRVPKYFPQEHPYTKWILNTFRSGANNRLTSMLRERPQLFGHVFQITDCPDKIMWDQCDFECMFKRSSVLYLRPLSLAVYMKRRATVQILIQSGLVKNTEISYATDTCVQSDLLMSGDIVEFTPDIVAIRRHFFEALPLIYNLNCECKRPLMASDPISMRYANKCSERIIHYQDIFAYSIEVVKKNKILNIGRLFDILVFHCPGFCAANVNHMFCPTHAGQNYSLFRRLLQPLVFGDPAGRLTFHLIQSMELLLRLKLFYNPDFDNQQKDCEEKPSMNTCLKFSRRLWSGLSCHTQDCLVSLALLMKLYDVILSRTSGGSLPVLGELISHVIDVLDCREYMENASTIELTKNIEFLLHTDHDPFGQLERSRNYICEEGDNLGDNSCKYASLSVPSWSTLNHIQHSVKTVADAQKMSLISRRCNRHDVDFANGNLQYCVKYCDMANNICPFCHGAKSKQIDIDSEMHNSTSVSLVSKIQGQPESIPYLLSPPPKKIFSTNDNDLLQTTSITMNETISSSMEVTRNKHNRRLPKISRGEIVPSKSEIENELNQDEGELTDSSQPVGSEIEPKFNKLSQVSFSNSKGDAHLALKDKFTLADVDLLIEKMINTNSAECRENSHIAELDSLMDEIINEYISEKVDDSESAYSTNTASLTMVPLYSIETAQ